MGDDESRREDARIEGIIERNLRNGTMGYCWYCGDPTDNCKGDTEDRWLCRPCQRMMDNPGD